MENLVHRSGFRSLHYASVELDGVRYAVLREDLLRRLCRRAKVRPVGPGEDATPRDDLGLIEGLDGEVLARSLVTRRRRAGLTQAELARRAGIRVETLNRVERGRTTPDFATIRKLVAAIKQAEQVGGGPAQ